MHAIMVMYDTLCRHFLQPYGNNWVKTPNFKRLAEKSVAFDNNYVCSLPCMPARRDLHNSRANFLQRDWGPLEPYDDSMPEELKTHGVYSMLVSDHYHYWEDGGCTYHNRYSAWLANRGQEGDHCNGDKAMVDLTNKLGTGKANMLALAGMMKKQDECNRQHILEEEEMPQAKTFKEGLDFINQNHDAGNWFLQIETFDPHEPYFTQEKWKKLYPEIAEYHGSKTDWPPYQAVTPNETKSDIDYVRNLYAALVSMCDDYLGKVLDLMDKYDMWKDTLLIVNTDHGFLLGEHEWWGKSLMPAYEEISHTPLFIYDPISKRKNERISQVTSPLDLPVTILDFFQVPVPKDMQGHSLLKLLRENQWERKNAIFGFFGGQVGVTDGHYVYFRAPLISREKECFEYTLMPTRMRERFSISDLQKADFVGPLPNSKGCKVLKTPFNGSYVSSTNFGTKLYDVIKDPHQKTALDDPDIEAKMATILVAEMNKAEAPIEQYYRLDLPLKGEVTKEMIIKTRQEENKEETPVILPDFKWSKEALNALRGIGKLLPKEAVSGFEKVLLNLKKGKENQEITFEEMLQAVKAVLPSENSNQIIYFIYAISRAE